MADLTEIQAAQAVKIIGSDLTGTETVPVNADADGLKVSQKPLNENTDKVLVFGKNQDNGLPIALNLDHDGNMVVTALTGFGADFRFGDVTTAALTLVPVRRTAYTEQTTNGQRSIASANAADTGAGTGARTVKITYLDQTGAGPFTETVTLNGTTGVNTVNTNICFIERVEVETVGSGGVNAGIITLYSAINKGGVAIGTINAGDNKTFWAHHYVPIGKTCNITGVSVSSTSTTVGAGAVFHIRSKKINGAGNIYPDKQVSDFVRLYGQSSTATRNYGSPIKVDGPARLQIYVAPESTTSTTQRASMDFFEP